MVIMSLNKALMKHVLFWIGIVVAFLGSVEQALDAGNNPIFGNGIGIPFVHHYVLGFIIIVISYLTFTNEDWGFDLGKPMKIYLKDETITIEGNGLSISIDSRNVLTIYRLHDQKLVASFKEWIWVDARD